ncbi:hypothetical protein M758_8G149300 [Ceratodon purpureus]|uniref:Uncharacterized protein n=1 Tax=Ceratodon purpureus TaxID=3225 RepID=A0A8T0H3Q3_CERPU|nr:hypothetical protein KC19_8G153200 [Ceratodon purpureus]KAG0608995.1 hypothetical protein M758_8G149300 [Ceratodon purpureus]
MWIGAGLGSIIPALTCMATDAWSMDRDEDLRNRSELWTECCSRGLCVCG